MSDDRKVSVSRVIGASAEDIFDALADPSKHPVIDGSGMVRGENFGPERLTAAGDKFGMKMKFGSFLPYRITNTVKEYEKDRLIAWAHLGGHRWRYELEPVDGGTRVTETFDWSTSSSPKVIEMMGYPKKHPANMEATLERLDEHVTGSS
jgi:uncharacterized protein YndB with AHSA1/START domain